jgi:protein ImuB
MFACIVLLPPPAGVDTSPPFEAMVTLAREFSPRVRRESDRAVVLEVSGLTRLLGDAATIGAELRRAAAGRGLLRVRVAVAPTRVAALGLAHARPGVTIVPAGGAAAALAPLSLDVMEVLAGGHAGSPLRRGSGAGTGSPLQVLKRWGIGTLGALAALPAADLAARLGPAGAVWQRLARGEDLEPFAAPTEAPAFEVSVDLDWPVEGLEPLAFLLGPICETLCRRLEQADRGAVAVEVRLRLATREVVTRTIVLPAPMRDHRVLRTLLLLDLESRPVEAGIEGVAIGAEVAPGRILQGSLLERALPAPDTLATLLARLTALMGADRCGAPALVDSHRPGAFAMVPFGPGEKGTVTFSSRTTRGKGDCPLLVLRRFRIPEPCRVTIEQDRPVRVAGTRQGLTGGRVEQWAGPWRSAGEWWEPPAPAGTSGGWNRDEWDVSLSDGGLYRIFRDRTTDRWFCEGVFD